MFALFQQYRRKPSKIKQGFLRVSHDVNALPPDMKNKYFQSELEYHGWDELIRVRIEKDCDVYLCRKFLSEEGKDTQE